MKKTFFILFISICALVSCADEPEPPVVIEEPKTKPKVKKKGNKRSYKVPLSPSAEQAINKKNAQPTGIEAAYVGMFEAVDYDDKKDYSVTNKINITLEQVKDKKITGHSIVAGNKRPFSGTYEVDNAGNYNIKVKEPGDDKYDGIFEFVAYPKTNKIEGKWMANNNTLPVSTRQFQLNLKKFKYNSKSQLPNKDRIKLSSSQHNFEDGVDLLTEDAYKFNASADILKKGDIENMYKGDLEIMRNAIYARHGYSFKNRKMRFFFDTYVDWYMPVSTDIRGDLTDLEKSNIDLLKRFEQHAERYYDDFGR